MKISLDRSPRGGRTPSHYCWVLLAGIAAAGSLGAAPGDAAREFPALAAKIPFLKEATLIYGDGFDRYTTKLVEEEERAAVLRYLEIATARPGTGAAVPEAELLALLGHDEPKVRALAVGALHLGGNPRVLPQIAALAGDEGESFSTHFPASALFLGQEPATAAARREREHFEKRTVGQLARRVVGNHMSAAGYSRGLDGRGGQERFAAYREEREGRDHCLGWFLVDLRRAGGRSSSVEPERVPKIRAVRAAVDALDPPYRDFVVLALGARDLSRGEDGAYDSNAPFGSVHFASGADLLAAGKALGPDRLLDLLGSDPKTGGPDLDRGRHNNAYFNRTCRFILQHAPEFFRPEHAGRLLELEALQWERKRRREEAHLTYTGWAAAAADADPGRADAILKAAFERFSGGNGSFDQDNRVILADAIWKHRGAVELDFLRDWFFAEQPSMAAFGFGRHRFARTLGEPGKRPLLAAVVADPRLEAVDWSTLWELARAVNQADGEEVFSHRELRRARHPIGRARYDWKKAEAAEKHPEETAKLEEVLAGWRAAMRAALRVAE